MFLYVCCQSLPYFLIKVNRWLWCTAPTLLCFNGWSRRRSGKNVKFWRVKRQEISSPWRKRCHVILDLGSIFSNMRFGCFDFSIPFFWYRIPQNVRIRYLEDVHIGLKICQLSLSFSQISVQGCHESVGRHRRRGQCGQHRRRCSGRDQWGSGEPPLCLLLYNCVL